MKFFTVKPSSFFVLPALFLLCGAKNFGIFLICVSLHELGHTAAMSLLRVPVQGIVLTPAGFVIERSAPCSYFSEAIIYLAGPVFGAASGAVFFAVGGGEIFYASLAYSVCNLLPLGSLDGGCVLRASLSYLLGCNRAETVCRTVGCCFFIPLYAVSVILLLLTDWNVSLLALCLILMYGVFSEKT